MYKTLRQVTEWIYPAGCVICGRECGEVLPICAICRRRLPFFNRPLCPVCRDFSQDKQPHRDCFAGSVGGLSLVWFAGMLDDGYRPLVHTLKYERQLSIGEFFGRRIGRNLAKSINGDGNPPLVTPVPLHPAREKQRGYNQSNAIAAGLAHATGFAVDETLLVRVRKTKDQTKLSPPERIANVRGAFKVTRSGCFTQRQVILVDDVLTTGATINECTRMISSDGADNVQAVVMTLARPIGMFP